MIDEENDSVKEENSGWSISSTMLEKKSILGDFLLELTTKTVGDEVVSVKMTATFKEESPRLTGADGVSYLPPFSASYERYGEYSYDIPNQIKTIFTKDIVTKDEAFELINLFYTELGE